MSGPQNHGNENLGDTLSALETLLLELPTSKLETVKRFMKEVVETESEATVEAFLTWKDHQVIDTILLLLADMDAKEQEAIMASVRVLIDENQTT